MVIEYHRQPRVLKAFTSYSEPFVSWQGMLAGCAHPTSLLTLLTLRAVRRVRASGVAPRALVDDLAIQWVGEEAGGISKLFNALANLKADVKPLGIVLQDSASG
eukprot:6160485-Pyramimonas_sp.AAC.1